ncbi:MAG: GTPase [Thermoguttaceae bacterium]
MLKIIQRTPPGRGAVATLRIEGPDAVVAVDGRFYARNGRRLADQPTDRPLLGHFGDPQGEEILVRRCADGAVELHGHGGSAAVAMIERSLADAGAQRVAWREQASSVAIALADAPTLRTASILLDQMHGALERECEAIRSEMAGGRIEAARRRIDALLARAALGRHLTRPWRVVEAGPVNAGKSSLINALAGFERAIVHPTPGTTRDAVTVVMAVDGWPVEWCDTAGLRAGGDATERAGVALACERLAQADLILLVFDLSAPWSAEDQALVDHWPEALVVYNKYDLATSLDDRPPGLRVSALRGDGLTDLLAAVSGRLVPDPPAAGEATPIDDDQIAAIQSLWTPPQTA